MYSILAELITGQIFLHDKRQTMRLKCPLPNRSRSLEPEAEKGDLPPLSEPFKAGGSNSKQSVVKYLAQGL